MLVSVVAIVVAVMLAQEIQKTKISRSPCVIASILATMTMIMMMTTAAAPPLPSLAEQNVLALFKRTSSRTPSPLDRSSSAKVRPVIAFVILHLKIRSVIAVVVSESRSVIADVAHRNNPRSPCEIASVLTAMTMRMVMATATAPPSPVFPDKVF